METFSALLAICAGNSPVPGDFPTQRPVTRSLDVFFVLRLNKRLSKQPWGWWFETPWRLLWRHRDVVWRQDTTWPNADLLSNGPLGTKFIQNGTAFIGERMMKMCSVKWQPFWHCFSVLSIMIISNMFSLIKQYNGWRDLSTRSREISQPLNFYS